MAVVIDGRGSFCEAFPSVFSSIFPSELCGELEALARRGIKPQEIRLRADKLASVVCDGGNIALSCVLDRAQMAQIMAELCEYSLYAYADTINKGYVTINGGIRVGVAGRAVMSGDAITGVYDISSLCFRLPRRISDVGADICKLLRKTKSGALIYSPPGVGKTTLLRSVIAKLCDFREGGGAMRVVVVDTRGELGVYLGARTLCADVLSGYSREIGIEIAARSLNAELVVCDELCGSGDVSAVIQARNSGVPVLATAHAQSLEALLRRNGFRRLHEACAFEYYVGISRRAGEREYAYDVTSWEEAERIYV